VRARRCRGEAGETLVELLITVSILGIAVVALLFGLATAVRLSGTHRTQSNAGVVVEAAAEAVKVATPVACGSLGVGSTAYNSALDTVTDLPSGWTRSNLSITNRACSGAPLQLQTITVRATAPDGGSSETVDVVKRSA
jgi:type II secretory pathway pseudopilin PulG